MREVFMPCCAIGKLGSVNHLRPMNCFHFSDGEKRDERKTTKSTSSRSFSTEMSDRETRRSGSELVSLNVSDTSAESFRRSPFPSLSERPNNLKVFTIAELKTATRNFSRSHVVGEGGFGCVYKGTIKTPEDPHSRMDIAVKQLSRRGLQGHKEWVTEVNVLGIVDHPNLVKLVGYCAEDDERGAQRLLIYEFMPNRSVEDHISPRASMPLSWDRRLKIAIDSARGLTYLHEEMDFQIIFRDFKSSNILLDGQWNAKLSDFGLAREGPEEGKSHVSTAVVGTIGYAAPEYIQTGRLTAKSDVWSYGIVLYELITGRRVLERNRPRGEQKLLEWIKPFIQDMRKFHMILDPRLEGQYDVRSARKLAAVANKCLVRHPKMRPRMSEVLELLKQIGHLKEVGSPQLPVKNPTPREASEEPERKKAKSKRWGIWDWRLKERGSWRNWTPKLLRTR